METITKEMLLELMQNKAEESHRYEKFHLSKAISSASKDNDFLEFAVNASNEYQEMVYDGETGLDAELLAESCMMKILRDEFSF